MEKDVDYCDKEISLSSVSAITITTESLYKVNIFIQISLSAPIILP